MYKVATREVPDGPIFDTEVDANTVDIKDGFVIFSTHENPNHPVHIVQGHLVVSITSVVLQPA